MKKGIIILSGGLDSTTLLYFLLKKGYYIESVSFNYNQRHKRELQMALKTCASKNVYHRIINIPFLHNISNSALTHGNEVPEGHYEDENMKQTVVPARNMLFATIAAQIAMNKKMDFIALGVHAGDHAIYPDCRKEFIESLQQTINLADYHKISIYTPFINMSKIDIVKKGLELEVNYKNTHTCYKGTALACGKCGACIERLEAFEENNIIDPLKYQD